MNAAEQKELVKAAKQVGAQELMLYMLKSNESQSFANQIHKIYAEFKEVNNQ